MNSSPYHSPDPPGGLSPADLPMRCFGLPARRAEVFCLMLCGLWIALVNLGLARVPMA